MFSKFKNKRSFWVLYLCSFSMLYCHINFFCICYWMKYFPIFKILSDISYQPRISKYSSSQHNPIYSRIIHSLFGIFSSKYIPISYNWDIYTFFYFFYNAPISFSCIHLFSCSSMYSYMFATSFLCYFSYFYWIFTFLVPYSYFYRKICFII